MALAVTGCSKKAEPVYEDAIIETVGTTESSLPDFRLMVLEPKMGTDGDSDMFVVYVSDLDDYDGYLSIECGDSRSDMFCIGDSYFMKLDVQANESDVHIVSSDGADLGTLDTMGHIGDSVNLHDLVQEVIKTDVGYVYLDISGSKFTVEPLTQRGDYSGQFASSGDVVYYVDELGEQSVILN